MIWEEAVQEAKEIVGDSDWENVMNEAKKIMGSANSKIARVEHEDYLNSQEWRDKREKVLKRDNNLCIHCKDLIDSKLAKSIFPEISNEDYILVTLLNLLKILIS